MLYYFNSMLYTCIFYLALLLNKKIRETYFHDLDNDIYMLKLFQTNELNPDRNEKRNYLVHRFITC